MVMVNNSTNINNINNINKTEKKLPFHLKSLNTKRQRHLMLVIQVLAWDRHTNVAEIKRLMGSHDITEKLLKVTIKTNTTTEPSLKNKNKNKCKKKDSTFHIL